MLTRKRIWKKKLVEIKRKHDEMMMNNEQFLKGVKKQGESLFREKGVKTEYIFHKKRNWKNPKNPFGRKQKCF